MCKARPKVRPQEAAHPATYSPSQIWEPEGEMGLPPC